MATWLYLFTENADYPDPVAEISFLAALEEDGETPYLMLAARRDAPMKSAAQGETVHLATRVGGELRLHGTACLGDETPPRTTPTSVLALYGAQPERYWKPLEAIDLHDAPRTVRDLGLEIDEERFARGQAYVKRLGPKAATRRRATPAADEDGGLFQIETPRVRLSGLTGRTVVGVDLTAGTWESGMLDGPKAYPLVQLVGDGESLDLGAVYTHRNLSATLADPVVRAADCLMIDGPCGTVGAELASDNGFWVFPGSVGTRACERELARMGVKLFWTTRKTLVGFDGASRWIARSIRLFRLLGADPGRREHAFETHPHAVFTLLARKHGLPRLHAKGETRGRSERLTLLAHYIDGLDPARLPDHDHVDAAGAALMAALKLAGQGRAVGSAAEGGVIWVPSSD